MFDSLVFNVGVIAAAAYQWGLVPPGVLWRPINIGGEYTGNYNLDAFTGQPHDGDMFYLDSTQNRGTPFDFSLNHMGWLWPGIQLNLYVTAFVAVGVIQVRMWYEEITIKKIVPQSVSIKESVRIDTKPSFGILERLGF